MKRLNALKKFGKQAAATVTVAVLSVMGCVRLR